MVSGGTIGAPHHVRRSLQLAGRENARRRVPERLRLVAPALGVGLRRHRDQVRQLGHRWNVTGFCQPCEPERIEGVAGQQTQVFVHPVEEAWRSVVEQIPLVDGLEHEEPLAELGAEALVGGPGPGIGRQCRIGGGDDLGVDAQSASSAARAASTVCSTWASEWASEGNQASNWEGGR